MKVILFLNQGFFLLVDLFFHLSLVFLRKNFKNKYLIHTLAIHHPGKQKYGKKYFTNLKGVLKYFNFQYLEYGEKWNSEEGRTFFLAKIK